MCPMYTWKDESSGKEISVVRTVAEIETPPTEEESGVKSNEARWKRLLCACTFRRGDNWGKGKGHWND